MRIYRYFIVEVADDPNAVGHASSHSKGDGTDEKKHKKKHKKRSSKHGNGDGGKLSDSEKASDKP
jgi:hypothetical protein